METIKHTLWVEKYRPQTIDDFIGNENIKNKFEEFIKNGEIQNILLYAHAGSGKTTMGKILTSSIPCDELYLNASDENNVDTVRNKIKKFAMTAGFKGKKIVFLDEADALTHQAQSIMRNLMEKYSENCRFILTCNYVEKILDPIKSRCQTYLVTPPSKKDVAKRMAFILKNEKVKFDKEDLLYILKKGFPDIRSCINNLQKNTIGNELMLDKTSLLDSNYAEEIIKKLNEDLKPEEFYDQARQIIADSGSKTHQSLFNILYKNLDKITTNKKPYVIQIIADGQYQYEFVVDKEITVMSMLMKIYQKINE